MKKAFKSVFTVGGSGSGGNNSKIATKNADYDEQQQHIAYFPFLTLLIKLKGN